MTHLTARLAPLALCALGLAAPACAASISHGTPERGLRPVPETLPALTPVAAPRAEFDHAHGDWNAILSKHVKGDGFDYGALAKDTTVLDRYLAALHAVTPEQEASWSRDQRFAFWINVYNAHTIQKVVENYPLKSIRKLDPSLSFNTVFDKDFIPMNAFHPKGKDDELSLNDIEHKILRERFKDARLHAAINCASYSCPPLLNEAFTAAKLDGQLEAQMKAFVVDPKRNVFDKKKNQLRLSEIFKWFDGDFERDAGSVREYVIRFAPEEHHAFLKAAKIRYIDYDWDLNDVPAQ